MTFLPSIEVRVAYTLAAFVLILTPGPDMTLFLGQTLAGGRLRGLVSMLGVSAGLVLHTMLAAFGLVLPDLPAAIRLGQRSRSACRSARCSSCWPTASPPRSGVRRAPCGSLIICSPA
jgi:hypothetical protein